MRASETGQSEKDKYCTFHSHRVLRAENRTVAARGWGLEKMESCLGKEFKFYKIESSGDSLLNSVNILTLLNCTLKTC